MLSASLTPLKIRHNKVFTIIWASTQENRTVLHANNKDADQPAHQRRLANAFVIRFLERMIVDLALCKISIV